MMFCRVTLLTRFDIIHILWPIALVQLGSYNSQCQKRAIETWNNKFCSVFGLRHNYYTNIRSTAKENIVHETRGVDHAESLWMYDLRQFIPKECLGSVEVIRTVVYSVYIFSLWLNTI